MSTFSVESAMKYTLWNEAKGKLLALVDVQGSYHSGSPPGQPSASEVKYDELKKRVEAFIEDVESEGLQE